MTADDAVAPTMEDVLANQPQSNFKSPFVEKSVPVEIDVGCMLAMDTANVIELKKHEDREEFIKSLSRDNAQLLINQLWQLPTERVETVVVATLPARTTVLPREKPVPKPKPPSKWEEYRKSKGLQTRKKDKMVWDEQAGEFRPRWGYKRANDDSATNWAIELPHNADLSEDPFEKAANAKKERVAKNELQRLRNIARGEKMNIPYQPKGASQQSTDHLTKAFHEVTKSTASLGKFMEKARDEPRDKRSGKKQKFESNLVDSKTEREKQMRILDEITSKRPILDTEKAARRQMSAEDKEKRAAAGNKDRPKKGAKPRRAWLPPDKYEKSKKIESIREAKREARGRPTKASKKEAKKGGEGGKGLAKSKIANKAASKGGKGGKGGGKAASKTRQMLKRSK